MLYYFATNSARHDAKSEITAKDMLAFQKLELWHLILHYRICLISHNYHQSRQTIIISTQCQNAYYFDIQWLLFKHNVLYHTNTLNLTLKNPHHYMWISILAFVLLLNIYYTAEIDNESIYVRRVCSYQYYSSTLLLAILHILNTMFDNHSYFRIQTQQLRLYIFNTAIILINSLINSHYTSYSYDSIRL